MVVGDRLDDGQAEADTPVGADPVSDAAAERQGQSAASLGSIRAPVLLTTRTASRGPREQPDVDPALRPRQVVALGVLQQVADRPVEQLGVAGHGDRHQVEVPGALRLLLLTDPVDGLGHQRHQVDRLVPGRLEPRLDPGQGEQRVDGPVRPVGLAQGHLGRTPELRGGGVGVGQRHVERGPLVGQRGAQLVRHGRDQPSFGLERGLDPVEQRVEGVGELAELVVRTAQRHPLVQRVRGDGASPAGDRVHRRQHPAGEDPPHAHRDRRGQQQADARPPQQPVESPVDGVDAGLEHRVADGRSRLRGRAAQSGGRSGTAPADEVGRLRRMADQRVDAAEQHRRRDDRDQRVDERQPPADAEPPLHVGLLMCTAGSPRRAASR